MLGKRGMLATPSMTVPERTPPTLYDPWAWAKPVRLSGWLERQQFHPVLLAFLVPVLAFVLYQVVGAVAVAAMVIPGAIAGAQDGVAPTSGELMAQFTERADLLLIGNSIGQFVGFGFLVFLIILLHTRQRAQFAYVRRPDTLGMLLSVVALFAVLPFNTWLAGVNEALPIPESIRAFDQSQMEMVEAVLGNLEISVGLALVLVALTPALCEEYLFRGYMQRQLERRVPVWAMLLLVGLVFGLYHLRLTQALPLSFLGAYLAFAVWATGSLWTGVLLHLLNNGLAVLLMDYAKRNPDSQVAALEEATMPWLGALASFAIFAAVAWLMLQRRRRLVGDAVLVEARDPDLDAQVTQMEGPRSGQLG